MGSQRCRVSGGPLVPVLDLGRQPLANAFRSVGETKEEYFFPLQVGFAEDSKMVQLLVQPPPELMFHEDYAFFSGTSKHMAQHFEGFHASVLEMGVGQDGFVVEIGSNDGIMLRHFAERGMRHLGVEPSGNVAEVARRSGLEVMSAFFSTEVAGTILQEHGHADAIVAANVMCHIPDIRDVARAISILLAPSGVLVFEEPYLGDIVTRTSYDQIYDEHVFFFSALSVSHLFREFGLELIDAIPQSTHGGSMRYVLAPTGSREARPSVAALLAQERALGLDRVETFVALAERVARSRDDLRSLLGSLSADGRRVVGYGATSKSTTILNYCGIGPDLIGYICDTTPIKQGRLTPGMHIPVVPHDAFVEDRPDLAVLFAWNHAEEILAKEHDFGARGGRWITHVPTVRLMT